MSELLLSELLLSELLLEAISLLERCRDQLLLKPDARIKGGEITKFIKKAKETL